MFAHRSLLAIATLAVVLTVSGSAHADVKGKTFPVNVYTSFATSFSDNLTFGDGGSPAMGPFTSQQGGAGTWQETNIGPLAIWSCFFVDGSQFRVDLGGLQYGTFLIGTGGSNEGDRYLVISAQPTGRSAGGSYKP